MSKIISQATFDDVVKENIVDFAMGEEEAKKETIKQFEAQGINLANIIKDLSINAETGKPVLNETIDKLKTHISEKTSETNELIDYLKILDCECQKSIPHRVLAGKNGAHDTLVSLLEQEVKEGVRNYEIVENCLKAANSLTHKQPDIFDAEALSIVLKLLEAKEESIICLALQWLQKASIMHEINRQNIINANIIWQMKPHINKNSERVIREAAALFRYLVLDDDIRVEFGRAHEHARQIANEFIVDLTKLMGDFEDENVLADLLLTISTLAVRQEFCKTIEDAGGLKYVLDIMTANPDSVRLNREALKMLRALAGNDTVKVHIIQQGAAPILKNILQTHMSNENVTIAALACISTLTLRVKENSAALFETGIAEIIVEAQRMHPKNKIIQRNAAWAIRNMVSRSREQCESWITFGAEELLNAAMTEHPAIQPDIKAALRDLGCNVQLKEEWTGVAEKKISSMQ